MLLKRWFTRHFANTAPESAARPRAPLDINLIAAQRSRAIIDLAVEGVAGTLQSAIIDVDNDAGLMLIDEWFPKHCVGRVGQRVTVSLRLGERRAQFDSEIAAHLRDPESERYRLRLPPNVGFSQRRAAYRLALRPGRASAAEFILGNVRHGAILRDVSSLGVRLELLDWLPLPRGSVLEDLEFEVLGERFHCAAEVRNRRDGPAGGTEIGAAFIDIPPTQQRALERAIMQAQRREARQQPQRPQAARALGALAPAH